MSLLNIIFEGKKENLLDKYKDSINSEDSKELIEKLIDSDPSVTKKYSEWMINELIRLWNSPSSRFDSLVDLMIFISEEIERFHKLHASITQDDIDVFLKMIDDYATRGIKYFNSESEKNKVIRSPKDIYSYPSIWSIQLLNNAIQRRKRYKEEEEEAKKNAKKIYEDNTFLIVEPFSHKSSCFYGAETKWCTTSRGDSSYFESALSDGRLIYIIDKKSVKNAEFSKFALQINDNGNIKVWDQRDNIRSLDFLLDRFKPISSIINKIIKGDSDYVKLKKLSEGDLSIMKQKLNAPYFLEMDAEYVYFNFDTISEYLSLLKNIDDEYELSNIVATLENQYQEIYDVYSFKEDLLNGYPLNYFNSEHLDLLREILQISDNNLSKYFYDKLKFTDKSSLLRILKKGGKVNYKDLYETNLNSKGYEKIGNFLVNFNSDLYDRLEGSYADAMNEGIREGLKKFYIEEFCNKYEQIGIKKEKDSECFDTYKMPIDLIIDYYEDDITNKDLTIDELIKDVLIPNMVDISIPPMYEVAFNELDEDTFKYHFNDELTEILEKFLDDIEENEKFLDIEEYKKIYNRIENKYGFNRYIKIEPFQDQKLEIKFEKVDPVDNKIEFTIRRLYPDYNFKKAKAKLSTIEKLMTNYSLFDIFED